MSYFANAGLVIVQFLFLIPISLFVVRVLLQLVRANFYNPICQFFYKATNPVLMPLRRALPPLGPLDTAGVTIAYLLCVLEAWPVEWLLGQPLSLPGLLVLGLAGLLSFVIWFFIVAILVRALISFISPDAYHPLMPLLGQLTEPLLRPVRRRVPPLGPFDLSPMLIWLALILANILVVAPLQDVGRALGRL